MKVSAKKTWDFDASLVNSSKFYPEAATKILKTLSEHRF
jgi:hypothetical protein